MTRHPMITSFVAAAVGIGLSASCALAQNVLGDGRKLDNNLRHGSGGINSPQPDQRLRYGAYQDAIVTGNVTGLARFRGNISYRAPGEFRGNLGSDDRYLFELQSRPTVPINNYQARQLGLGEGWRGQGNRVTTQRAGAGATIGDVNRSADAPRRNVLYTDTSALLTSTNASVRTLDSTLLNVSRPTVGLTADQQGNMARLEASPLVGLRVVPVNPIAGPQPRPDAAEDPEDTDEPDNTVAAPRIDPTRITDKPAGTEVADATDPRITDKVNTALRIDGSPASQQPEGAALSWVDAKPGEDIYMDLLRRSGQLVDAQPPDENVEPGDEPDGEGGAVVGAPRTRIQEILEKFEEQDAELAEKEKELAEKRLIARLAATLEQGAPRVTTLVGEGETAYNRTMAEAERLMADGKYFKAEAEYVTAMRLKPGQPMAMVGRIHAQMGAGLFLSAGTNLRMLMSVFPEMMATQYGGPLLPTGERQEKVRKALTATLRGETRPEVHFLAAYLAFQEGDNDLAGRALATAEKYLKDDRLIKIAKVVWTIPQPDAPDKPDEAAGGAE